MPQNPYLPPREPYETKDLIDRRKPALWLLGITLAGINLLTFFPVGVRETLVYFDPFPAAILYLGGFVAGMVLIPLLADKPSDAAIDVRWRASIATVLVLLELPWLFNIFVGTFCRGPNWTFYWPWESRDEFRLVALNSMNLSLFFWQGFGSRPGFWLLRELPGIVLVAGWLIAIPLTIALLLSRRFPNRTPGFWRLLGSFALCQLLSLLPLKMLLQWALNLNYLVAIPESMFNI
jgi:hypothetical protein